MKATHEKKDGTRVTKIAVTFVIGLAEITKTIAYYMYLEGKAPSKTQVEKELRTDLTAYGRDWFNKELDDEQGAFMAEAKALAIKYFPTFNQ